MKTKTTIESILVTIMSAVIGVGFISSTGVELMIESVCYGTPDGAILAAVMIISGFVMVWFANHETHSWCDEPMNGDEEEEES